MHDFATQRAREVGVTLTSAASGGRLVDEVVNVRRENYPKYFGDPYIQHNPHAADGLPGLVAWITSLAEEGSDDKPLALSTTDRQVDFLYSLFSVKAAGLDTRIASVLEAFPALRVAYLFGSQQCGNVHPSSDLDIAVQFDRQTDVQQRGELILRLIAALSDELGPLGERADILDLDHASTTISFRAIQTGRCIFARVLRGAQRPRASGSHARAPV